MAEEVRKEEEKIEETEEVKESEGGNLEQRRDRRPMEGSNEESGSAEAEAGSGSTEETSGGV